MTGDLLKAYREVRNNLNECYFYGKDKAEISKESLETIMNFMLDKDKENFVYLYNITNDI